MKKWIEKDGKHVLVVEVYGTEKEILELEADEDCVGDYEVYFLHKSLSDYSIFEDDILFDDLGEAKKEIEKRLFEYIKNTISELQSISEMLEA